MQFDHSDGMTQVKSLVHQLEASRDPSDFKPARVGSA